MTHNILELIGNTPMIKLSRFNPHFNFNLYVKCEFTNPTLSIKDRIVLSMIRAFEVQNKLKPGDTILEASSGNTGSSLAMIAAVLGYKAIITVPAKTSSEKVNTMRAFGADVIICDPSPPDSPEHYTNKAGILAKTMDNAVFLGQYENPVNVETHYRETAQECRYLVKDSGTSESPKSTHQRGKYFSLDCPASDIFALTAPGKMSSQ